MEADEVSKPSMNTTYIYYIVSDWKYIPVISLLNNKVAVLSVLEGITVFPHDSETTEMVNSKEQKINEVSIKIYPNPFSEYFFIEFLANKNQLGKVNIYNIYGQLIYSQNNPIYTGVNRIEYNLNFLQAGIYFIEMEYDNTIKSFKIIKT